MPKKRLAKKTRADGGVGSEPEALKLLWEAVQNGSRLSPQWHGIRRLSYTRSTWSNPGITESELLAERK
ncbi:hypothetical protein Tco_0773426 [Tanacetum coccineum]|uniref:Uncharacterized protein n=1 Tax=Tanacetum coccineum TaxID=301880 RepID=A0ABQ4ZP61_9ASTR